MTPPKCTKGPYCPTEAPPEIDIAEAKVDNKPASVFGLWEGRCAAKILSAGPCHLFRLANLKIIDTIIPAIIGPLITRSSLGSPNNKCSSPRK